MIDLSGYSGSRRTLEISKPVSKRMYWHVFWHKQMLKMNLGNPIKEILWMGPYRALLRLAIQMNHVTNPLYICACP